VFGFGDTPVWFAHFLYGGEIDLVCGGFFWLFGNKATL
jgi:hypothetical protein